MGVVDHEGKLFLELPSKLPQPLPFSELDPALRDPLERLSEGLWHTFRVVEEFRSADAKGQKPDLTHRISELKGSLNAHQGEQRDLLSTVDFEAEGLSWPAQVDPAKRALPRSASSPDADRGRARLAGSTWAGQLSPSASKSTVESRSRCSPWWALSEPFSSEMRWVRSGFWPLASAERNSSTTRKVCHSPSLSRSSGSRSAGSSSLKGSGWGSLLGSSRNSFPSWSTTPISVSYTHLRAH